MMKAVGYLINTKDGLQGDKGIFYDYILTGEGIYLRARNEILSVTINIAGVEVRGLASLADDITILHGKIPLYFLELALSILSTKPDTEQYLAIVWEGDKYSLKIPPQDAGPGHVNYETVPNTILDIHSHTGSMPAHFSGIDDHDEQGLKIYAVAADLRNLFPTVEIRLGIYGHYLPLNKSEVFT